MNQKVKIFTLSSVILLLLSACAVSPENPTGVANQQNGENPNKKQLNDIASEIYSRGQAAISNEEFALASEQFSKLIKDFPDDTRLPNALLGKAYAQYKVGNNKAASRITKRFIKSYKKHPLLDYAYYLNGLTRYNPGIEHLQNNELVSNNRPTLAREAFESFSYLVRRYPDSRYVEDSRLRMEVLFNKLAEYELAFAKDSFQQEKNRDAIARAEYIIKHYMDTHAAQEAYALMISAYEALGDLSTAELLRLQFAQKFPKQPMTNFEQGS